MEERLTKKDTEEIYRLTADIDGELHIAYASITVAPKWLKTFANNAVKFEKEKSLIEESRKQFEQHIMKEVNAREHLKRYANSMLKRHSNGDYMQTWVDMQWEGWKAALNYIEKIK